MPTVPFLKSSRARKIAIVAATGLLATTVGFSAGIIFGRSRAPAMVLAMLPDDGIAGIAEADRDQITGAGLMNRARALRSTARYALRQAPLNAAAIRTMAMAEIAERHDARGYALLKLAERITRQDLGTHLALIEYRSAAGDVAGALREYDLALSTNKGAGNMLFPILIEALSEPQIRQGLIPYVRADRPWLRGFMTAATNDAGQAPAVAELVAKAGGLPANRDYRAYETLLLASLAAQSKYAELKALYLSLPGARSNTLRTVDFSGAARESRFGPLAWMLADTPDLSVNLAGDGARIEVSPNARGTALRRLLYLPSGVYRFQATMRFPDQDGSGKWSLQCVGSTGSTMVWEQGVKPRDEPNLHVEWRLPANCSTQLLQLNVVGEDSQVGSTIEVSELAATPVRINSNLSKAR